MQFFNIKEAPPVHIEAIPSNTVAVTVRSQPYRPRNKRDYSPSLMIKVWAPGPDIIGSASIGEERFIEEYCNDCHFHVEEMETEADGYQYIDIDGYECTLTGTLYAYSPCPCYSDGIGEVSFPCPAGYDSPDETYEDELDTDEVITLKGDAMAYEAIYNLAADPTIRSHYVLEQLAYQELIDRDDDGGLISTDFTGAINCYQSSNSICWGAHQAPSSLLGIEAQFVSTTSNQDLLSFGGHNSNNEDAHNFYPEHPEEHAFEIKAKGRPMAVVCAPVATSISSFLLLGSSGAHVNGTVAYIPVEFYPKVKLDDDTIIDVWLTDVLPIGKRLAFVQTNPNTMNWQGIFIGQIEPNTDLTPCNSTQQQSSEQVAQVST